MSRSFKPPLILMMSMMSLVTGFSIMLILSIKQPFGEAASFLCPSRYTRQITSADILNWSVDSGIASFSSLIAPTHLFNEGYFAASYYTLPNTGYLEFNKEMVLIGITSKGFFAGSKAYYVSNFTFHYFNNHTGNEGNGIPYAKPITASSFFEVTEFFDKPLQANKLQFTIHNVYTTTSIYYWRLNIYGCEKSKAIEQVTDVESSTSSLYPINATQTQSAELPSSSQQLTYGSPSQYVYAGDSESDGTPGLCQERMLIFIFVIPLLIVVSAIIMIFIAVWYRRGYRRIRYSAMCQNNQHSLSLISGDNGTSEEKLIRHNSEDDDMTTQYYNYSTQQFLAEINHPHSNGLHPPVVESRKRSIEDHKASVILSSSDTSSSSLSTEEEIESTENPAYSLI